MGAEYQAIYLVRVFNGYLTRQLGSVRIIQLCELLCNRFA